jgi:16S rRNA C1402 N4-methylase RsmH
MWTAPSAEGHSRAVLARLGPAGTLVAFDKDPAAIAEAGTIKDARFSIEHASFAEMGDRLAGRGPVAGVLLDLGISSPQIDEAAGGFPFVSRARWTCAWTPRAALPPPSGLHKRTSRTLPG